MTDHLLFHPIDRHAAAAPDRIAFRSGGRSLTYAALAERTNRLAQLLLQRGVGRGDRIGMR